MTSPWTDGEDLTAALMYTRTTALITALQTVTADSGYVTSGIFTAANGCTISSQKGRIIGNRAFVRVSYTIGAAAVTAAGAVGTSGALTNTSVCNIVDTRFQTVSGFASQALPSATVGRISAHVASTDNTIKLCAVGGSATISNGDAFSFSGSYLLD